MTPPPLVRIFLTDPLLVKSEFHGPSPSPIIIVTLYTTFLKILISINHLMQLKLCLMIEEKKGSMKLRFEKVLTFLTGLKVSEQNDYNVIKSNCVG